VRIASFKCNCNVRRVAASATPVPLFTLFALRTLLDWEATISNNVKGGTMHADAGGAMRIPSDSATARQERQRSRRGRIRLPRAIWR